jgi:hypothetical protein
MLRGKEECRNNRSRREHVEDEDDEAKERRWWSPEYVAGKERMSDTLLRKAKGCKRAN